VSGGGTCVPTHNSQLLLVPFPYYVGWGTLALINAGLPQGKGHNGLLWFIVSLFLGTLATLLVVLFPATRLK
jgi:hypothetical protein